MVTAVGVMPAMQIKRAGLRPLPVHEAMRVHFVGNQADRDQQ